MAGRRIELFKKGSNGQRKKYYNINSPFTMMINVKTSQRLSVFLFYVVVTNHMILGQPTRVSAYRLML